MPFRTPAAVNRKRLVADVAIGAIFCSIGLMVDEDVFGDPVERGFFRNDESIQYPLKESESVSTGLLIVICFIVPLFVIPLVDVIVKDKQHSTLAVLRGSLHRLSGFCVGFGMTVMLTGIGKSVTGRLRPDFIARCAPNYTGIPPAQNWIPTGAAVCTGERSVVIKGRKSFPSGHSSLAAFALPYLAAYLWRAVPSRMNISAHVLALLQSPLVGLALYIALSRTSDYVHHGTDVLGGVALGLLTAAFTLFVVLHEHWQPEKKDLEEPAFQRAPDVELAGRRGDQAGTAQS